MEETTMFTCALCGAEFSTPQQLQLHRVEEHSHEDEPAESLLQFDTPAQEHERGEVF